MSAAQANQTAESANELQAQPSTWDDPDGCYSIAEMHYKREKRHELGECDEDCEFCVC